MNLNADSSANVNDDCENDSEDMMVAIKLLVLLALLLVRELIVITSMNYLIVLFFFTVFDFFVSSSPSWFSASSSLSTFLICSFFLLFGQYAIGGMTNAESFKCRTSFESILLRFRVRREVDKKDFGTMIS